MVHVTQLKKVKGGWKMQTQRSLDCQIDAAFRYLVEVGWIVEKDGYGDSLEVFTQEESFLFKFDHPNNREWKNLFESVSVLSLSGDVIYTDASAFLRKLDRTRL